MIAAFKRYDGRALLGDKIRENSGEQDEKIGEILDTTLDPSIFPHPTNNFQEPVRFVNPKGDVVGEKKGEKPSEQPQPEPKKPIHFYCGYSGRDGHKDEFCFKRKREERLAKEWANKDRYHPSNGVPEPCMQMPRPKAIVKMVPAWVDQRVAGGAAGLAPPVKPVRGPVRSVLVWVPSSLVSMLVRMLSSVPLVMV
jgi:hypothetical protein